MRSPKPWNRSSIGLQEHLGSTDRAIVIGRHLLIQAAHALRQGKEPIGLQSSYYETRAIGKVIPADAQWLDVMKNELYPDGNADASSTFKV